MKTQMNISHKGNHTLHWIRPEGVSLVGLNGLFVELDLKTYACMSKYKSSKKSSLIRIKCPPFTVLLPKNGSFRTFAFLRDIFQCLSKTASLKQNLHVPLYAHRVFVIQIRYRDVEFFSWFSFSFIICASFWNAFCFNIIIQTF